jgi:non-ribosomal peptide synthase protein (TIGR01720 family)
MGLERVGIHEDFFELGGDSVVAIQILTRMRDSGIPVTSQLAFRNHTVAGLAAAIEALAANSIAEPVVAAGDVPLTPIQRRFFERHGTAPEAHIQSLCLEATEPLIPQTLRSALRELVGHHDALRMQFIHDLGGWTQRYGKSQMLPELETVTLRGASEEDLRTAIEEQRAGLHARISLSDGPLMHAVLFSNEGRPDCPFLAIHHLVVDALSWAILLADLQEAYRQLAGNQPVRLPPKTMSCGEWAASVAIYAGSADLAAEADFWRKQRPPERGNQPLDPEAPERRSETSVVFVDTGRNGVPAGDLVLAALAQSVADVVDGPDVWIDLEAHGRMLPGQPADVSRTVGWFTAVYPIHLRMPPRQGPAAAIQCVRDQLARVPAGGVGYGVLRYLSRAGELDFHEPAISFVYLGQIDSLTTNDGLLRPRLDQADAAGIFPGSQEHALEVCAFVTEGMLRVHFFYDGRIFSTPIIDRLGKHLVSELRALTTFAGNRPMKTAAASVGERILAMTASPATHTAPAPACLAPLRPTGSRTPLFCVHPAGGTALCYVMLARMLDEARPFYGLQAPVGEAGSEFEISELAARYLADIRSVQPHGPYVLAGWSMGGTIAFEIALQMERQDEKVAFLALFDSRPTVELPEPLRARGRNPRAMMAFVMAIAL